MWSEASFVDQVVQCSASSLGRTTVHSITTQPSMTMTEMTWETAVTTAPTTTTQTRLTQITMGKETPAQLTLMGTVRCSLIQPARGQLWRHSALSLGQCWLLVCSLVETAEAEDSSSYLSVFSAGILNGERDNCQYVYNVDQKDTDMEDGVWWWQLPLGLIRPGR